MGVLAAAQMAISSGMLASLFQEDHSGECPLPLVSFAEISHKLG